MASTQCVYYRDREGVEPVADFIGSLGPLPAAKIDDWFDEYLNGQDPGAPPPEYPITSQIDGELRELRVRFAKTRYRVLYRRSGNLVVLLHALEKHSGPVPEPDIRLARQRFADFQRRMNQAPRLRPRAAGHDAPPGTRGRP